MSRVHTKKTQTDLLPGMLELLVLKTLQSGRLTVGTLLKEYSRFHVMCCEWARDRCIRRCTGWRRRARSLKGGRVGEQLEGEILQPSRRRPEAIEAETETWRLFLGSRTDSENVLNGRI